MELFRNWGRRKRPARARIPDPLWRVTVRSMPFLDGFTLEDEGRLRELAERFLEAKEMHGAGGLELTDTMRVSVAVQACLPILNLGLECYDGWVGVVVYPGEFRVQRQDVDEAGVLHEWTDDLSGEVVHGGPVVLSWEDIGQGDAGYNVVIHEFAHKLDALSGEADGLPPTPAPFRPETWRALLREHYEDFCHWVDSGEPPAFDEYAAEHPAEFFAVMSEAFFTEPATLKEVYADLYDALQAFYRQDPHARLRRADATAQPRDPDRR